MTTPSGGASLPPTPTDNTAVAKVTDEVAKVESTIRQVSTAPAVTSTVTVLAQKAGYKTTEFYSHVVGLALTWVTVFLSLSGQFQTVVPGKYQPWVVLAGSVATAIQTGLYALSRAHAKAGTGTTTVSQ